MSLSRRVANTRRRRCQAACSSRPTRARTRRIPNDTAQARAELGRCLPHGATVGCELAIFRRTDLQEATISDVERREDERGFLACTWRSTGSTIPAAWPKSTNLVPAATGPRWCCTSPRQALVNRSVADSGELFATCATFRRCNGLEEVDRTHDVRGEAGSGVASVVCITSHKARESEWDTGRTTFSEEWTRTQPARRAGSWSRPATETPSSRRPACGSSGM